VPRGVPLSSSKVPPCHGGDSGFCARGNCLTFDLHVAGAAQAKPKHQPSCAASAPLRQSHCEIAATLYSAAYLSHWQVVENDYAGNLPADQKQTRSTYPKSFKQPDMFSPSTELAGKTVFVTGGLGFLGSVVVEQLLRLTEVRAVKRMHCDGHSICQCPCSVLQQAEGCTCWASCIILECP
jgi:hypothetical protein